MPRSVTYNQYLSAPAANDAWTVPTNTTRCKQTCKLCLVMFHMKSAIRNTIHVSESFREKMHTTYHKVSNYILVNGQGEGVICYSMCPLQVLFSPPTFWIWTYGQTPLPCLVEQRCCYLVTTATVTLGQAVPSGSQGTFTQDCFTHFTDHDKRGSVSV